VVSAQEPARREKPWYRRREEDPALRPSSRWLGAAVSLSLLLAVLWLLSYTLLDWGWQQGIGAWNYLIAFVLANVPSQILQRWHGDPRRFLSRDSRGVARDDPQDRTDGQDGTSTPSITT
jgi:hypothetical protein